MPDLPDTPQTRYVKWVPAPGLMKKIGRWHTTLYRLTGGLLGGRMDGLSMLLLTTRGRKSGAARTVPLPYFRDGSRYLLIASYGGNADNPAWLKNIAADGDVAIQVGFRRMQARATIAEEPERGRLWAAVTAAFPRYLEYQKKTDRVIPIVIIQP